jgi:L-alanine-DL-glutamate epimerase-like enolase superfamily enzyme
VKVTGIRTTPFAYERARRFGDVNHAGGAQWHSHLAVQVDTDDGLVGCALANPGCEAAVAALAELVVGEDPAHVRGLWERMGAVLFKRGAVGAAGHARAAIDMALWDLKAKEQHEPLWETLGASNAPVGAYASGLDMPLDDEELRSYYTSMAALGFSAGKLKVGLDSDDDLRRLGIMRDALLTGTGRATLMVDANEFWSAKQAIRRVHEMEERFDIAWVEEPVDRLDVRGLRQVSDGVRAAVATGENLVEVRDFVTLVRGGAVDVVEPNVQCGITGSLQVAELAYAHNLPMSMVNCPGHVLAHVAALFPTHWMMEVLDPHEPAVVKTAARLVDGRVCLDDTPGHGMWIDEDELRAHCDAPPAAMYQRHPDARRHESGRQR